ncbi:hypothetical protein AAFC00_006188 [Neodothiora populina]|uniref:Ran GTPase activating protein 1 n=1 Tax=Neodothiora populina TaxID=2781224 RepID=A0ABR3P4D4_9PEZI
MSSTKLFTLEGKSLKLDSAADIEPHLKDLVASNDVEEARFQGNTLGVEACEALAKVLETKKTLKTINLADIFTGRLLSEIPTALTHLLTALLALPNLTTVNLSDNAFGLNTVEPLRPFLSQHAPLQHLILNNNGLGPAAGTLVAEALTQLATKKQTLREQGNASIPDLATVVCGRNRLETGSMAAWVQAYSVHTSIQTVKMVQNGIRQEGISSLLQNGLSKCHALKVLDLQDNTFTAMGARALADVVGSWTRLIELGVGDSLLSARGGVMLVDALSKGKNTSLEILRLQYNEIDAKGLDRLARVAEAGHLPALRRVEVNGNKFSEDHPALEVLKIVLDARKAQLAPDADDEDEDAWGIDELDDLEDESDEEDGDGDEDEDENEDEDEDEEEKIVKEADLAESEPVAADHDKTIDDLADRLGKTGI